VDVRRALGAALLGVGVLLVVVGGAGAAGLIGGFSVSPGPVAIASPTSGPTTTTPTSPPPTLVPPSPTVDPTIAVRAFFDDLVAAIRSGNVSPMGARLNGAVIDRYGVAACEAQLASRDRDPTYAVTITTIHDLAPWDYVTDDMTTTIPLTWTIDASVTALGATAARELHVAPGDDEVTWFTDCGTPL
jgi:hypothetical protein